jgi:hypothetical protein
MARAALGAAGRAGGGMIGALAVSLLGAAAGFAVSCFGAACAFAASFKGALCEADAERGAALGVCEAAFWACGRAEADLAACWTGALGGAALGLGLALTDLAGAAW